MHFLYLTAACLSLVAAQTSPQIQILHRHVQLGSGAHEKFSIRGAVGPVDVNGTAQLLPSVEQEQVELGGEGWDTYQLVASTEGVEAKNWPMTSIPAVSACPCSGDL